MTLSKTFPLTKPTVLVVDDIAANRELLEAYLVDLGYGVRQAREGVLLKPGPLSEEELTVMRTHAIEGEKICGSLRSVAEFLPIIRHHHERWDGQGYPDHLYRAEIPLGARIAAVADSWDAMVSDQPYREGLSLDEARQRLADGAGQQWEPELVEIFTRLLDGGSMRQVRPTPTGG